MKVYSTGWFKWFALVFISTACSTVDETGRRRIALIPASVMNSLGASAYAESIGSYPVITGTKEAQMVERAGKRIAQACGKNYEWEFKLLDAPDVVNAFCLPGGKIAIYTGILPITQNEDGLAVVMGHEVAHATAEHGNERMTMSFGIEAAATLATAAVGNWSKASPEKKAAIAGAIGAGAQFGVLLPFSREHESEADEIGLRYAIRAGYNPEEAPRLWERMAKMSAQRQPEFMSTHPDPEKRAQRLRELIPRLLAEEKARIQRP